MSGGNASLSSSYVSWPCMRPRSRSTCTSLRSRPLSFGTTRDTGSSLNFDFVVSPLRTELLDAISTSIWYLL